jgi:hypothetical protein
MFDGISVIELFAVRVDKCPDICLFFSGWVREAAIATWIKDQEGKGD